MEGGTTGQSSPRGLRRLTLRLPILIYRITLTRMMLGATLTPDLDGCARLAARVPLVALTYRNRMEDA